MKAEISNERQLTITRDENDKPQVIVDLMGNDRAKNAAEFNSRRKDYKLRFDTKAEAEAALAKVISIGDFDKAAAWLDKQ